ncbi:hypothetical protein HMN09_01162800 [Mycena chlorophos]|uniref:C3H1-type domain-containing protein n=1 Tax=Mycena chlorophos TaxID=658473 RepID=A0A8H6S7I1_MYCCL|nr:hypothetical protein HMN09_01162800 [Mycena chlorophos]
MNNPPAAPKPRKSKKKPAKKPTNQQTGAGGTGTSSTQRNNGGPAGQTNAKGKGKQKAPQNQRASGSGPQFVQQPSLASKVAARKAVSVRKRIVAEKEYDKALMLHDAGDYDAALSALKNACRIFKTEPKYALKMASVFMKLKRYDDAIDMATFHIAVDDNEQHIASRFLRATAFIERGDYGKAAVDLINCKNIRPDALEVAAAIEHLHTLWDPEDDYFSRNPAEADTDVVHGDLSPCTANYDLDCESDTEESTHMGNGQACKKYNTSSCGHGSKCRMRHAVDAKSIRDKLGRNVCIFYLIDRCYKGSACLYRHSKEHLPKLGWWANTEYVAYYRGMYDILHDNGVSDKNMILGDVMNGRLLPFDYRTDFVNATVQSLKKTSSERLPAWLENVRRGLKNDLKLGADEDKPVFFPSTRARRRYRRRIDRFSDEDEDDDYDSEDWTWPSKASKSSYSVFHSFVVHEETNWVHSANDAYYSHSWNDM